MLYVRITHTTVFINLFLYQRFCSVPFDVSLSISARQLMLFDKWKCQSVVSE